MNVCYEIKTKGFLFDFDQDKSHISVFHPLSF